MSDIITWKHTIDGQWQPFSQITKGQILSNESVYKPSSMSKGKEKKMIIFSEEDGKIQKSSVVWTQHGYSTVKQIIKKSGSGDDNDEEIVESLKIKPIKQGDDSSNNESQQLISVDISDAKKTIDINVRVLDGQKVQWLHLTFGLNAKVQALHNIISSMYNKGSYFISTFHNSKLLDKKVSFQECKVKDGDFIFVTLNSGQTKVFKRFRDISTSYWYVTSSWDAITFKSSKPLLVTGFGCFKQYYVDNYEIRYKMYKDEAQIVSETKAGITPALLKDKVGKVTLKSPQLIPANTNFTITYVFESVSGQSNHAFYGQNGSDPKTIPGNDNFIEVFYSNKDQNGSGVDSGQIPELHYIPM